MAFLTAGDPFFVVGFPRSGTTLVSVLLDRHSRLCVTPETAFYDELAPRIAPNDEVRVRKLLRGWRRLPELGLDVDDVIVQLPRPWSAGDVLAAMLALYASVRGKPRCGEKTPQHLNHVPAILQQFPAAKIVCVERDGRDAVLSLRAMPWFRGSLAAAAEMWKTSVELARRYSRDEPARFTTIRYEDLVGHPGVVLAPVMQFLGESFEPEQLRPDVASHVVLPRSMEWKGRALGTIESHEVGRRRASASAKDLAFLESALHDYLT